MYDRDDVAPLTAEQRSVLIGSLLGDATMRCKSHALLEINHSIRQKTYVDWKHQVFAGMVTTPPRPRAGNGGRIAYRFTTRSLPELTPYYRLFYGSGRKAVPNIRLTPLALAVWFMDDGSRSYRSAYLNTQQFSVEEQWRLVSMLREQFGIIASLNRDRNYYRLRIAVASMERLRAAIGPHLLPELSYKLAT